MSVLTIADAEAVLADRNVIAVGARGDDERRRRHGTRTTFVRVLGSDWGQTGVRLGSDRGQTPPPVGEVRVTGKPPSVAAAVASVQAARALAGSIPVTAYSLADLLDLAGADPASLTDLAGRLAAAGLVAIAEAPIDLLPDAAQAIRAVRAAGLDVPRLTIQQPAADPLRLMALARDLQSAIGGVRAFAPLPRVQSVAQPTTGFDDVRQIAVTRLVVHNIDSIQVDWALYGPKLAQVALTMGADDVDNVSPFEGDLGRRRSPLEEIKGNITAAGLTPVERDGAWRIP